MFERNNVLSKEAEQGIDCMRSLFHDVMTQTFFMIDGKRLEHEHCNGS